MDVIQKDDRVPNLNFDLPVGRKEKPGGLLIVEARGASVSRALAANCPQSTNSTHTPQWRQ